VQPIRKPFVLEPNFPFHIVYRGVRDSENELPDHLHDLYEAVYIHEGKGTFFIDDSLFDKEAGDLFLIPGNTVHRSFPSTDDPIVSTAVFFAPSLVQADSLDDGYDAVRCYHISRRKKQYKIRLTEPVRRKIEATLGAMASELNAKESGYRHALRLQLQMLLLEMNRHPFTREMSLAPTKVGPPWIQNALRAINQDPFRCGGLSDLSDQACVSPSHFSRAFKQLTGINVTDYVNAKRLIRAKELLLETDDNVETIALACGFQGMRHFYETFKKMTGFTPGAYRSHWK